MFKIGFGYDLHTLSPAPQTTHIALGGILIPHNKSIEAHSDGDVLIHAIIDALFGALALGDIGTHFPDTDPTYKGVNSATLLQQAYRLVQAQGYTLGNVDATIIAQKPKLSPYIFQMRESLAQLLDTEIVNVSVKATTNEKVDATGQEQAIAVHAIALLAPMPSK